MWTRWSDERGRAGGIRTASHVYINVCMHTSRRSVSDPTSTRLITAEREEETLLQLCCFDSPSGSTHKTRFLLAHTNTPSHTHSAWYKCGEKSASVEIESWIDDKVGPNGLHPQRFVVLLKIICFLASGSVTSQVRISESLLYLYWSV